ncbi:MAG TPA: UDP-3-O-(3-hydroxymyristoyl)glucosamine N-acyltransferase [Thermoanaerobaculia bacterium]|nr:UDP-3-O-(3-hydroxymyristoyl)glucosamine N-acyltransferase [Thermoanaerobaculia bacterium]
MTRRLAELAELVGGTVEGDPERSIEGVRTLDAAGPRDLSFLNHPRYREQASASQAGALLVPRTLAGLAGLPGDTGKDLLVVSDAAYALSRLIALFNEPEAREPGVHPTAVLEPGCAVDPAAHVGPYVVIGAGSRVAAGAVLHAHVVVGRRCAVGERAVLYPHVVLYDGTEVGAGGIVHSGAVLGSDGFGYATARGVHHKVPQVGRVVVHEDVEIGANTTIDRATLGETVIGAGTKIDNLVQIGHNVRVGRHCILCGQAGIAGSTHLGDGVVMAGQAGAAGHIHLGDRAQVAAKSAALATVPAGTTVAGIPAVEMRKWRRQAVLVSRLEEMSRRLRALERRLHLEHGSGAPEAPEDIGEEE